jgi:hypothetical protein
VKGQETVPLWARRAGLDAAQWAELNGLLEDGWQPDHVRTKYGIPRKQVGSLRRHAMQYRDKRVKSPLNQTFSMVAQGLLALGPRFIRLLGMAMDQGLSNPHKTQRTAATMTQLFARILEIGVRLEEAKARQAEAEGKPKQQVDGNEAVRQMLAEYRISRSAEAVGGNGRQGGNGRSITAS